MRQMSLVWCVGMVCVLCIACSSNGEGVSDGGPGEDAAAGDTAAGDTTSPGDDAATDALDTGAADVGEPDAAEADTEGPDEDAGGGSDDDAGGGPDEDVVEEPDEDVGGSDRCDPIPSGPGRVQIGFFREDDCSGEPIAVNSYPIEADAPCYCWPGGSGRNSADSFSCNGGDGSFTYVQYNTLTCGEGDDTPTTKTSYTTRCERDIPPTLYSMILDYSACE